MCFVLSSRPALAKPAVAPQIAATGILLLMNLAANSAASPVFAIVPSRATRRDEQCAVGQRYIVNGYVRDDADTTNGFDCFGGRAHRNNLVAVRIFLKLRIIDSGNGVSVLPVSEDLKREKIDFILLHLDAASDVGA